MNSVVGIFRWNNVGEDVNDKKTYSLDNDSSNSTVFDVDLPDVSSITINAYADDDQDWPTSNSHENSLRGSSVTFDSRVAGSMGPLTIGPTTTDNDNTGYQVVVELTSISPPPSARVRIQLRYKTAGVTVSYLNYQCPCGRDKDGSHSRRLN
jgi:hypothetical protein